ncbi:TPA: hypothetical protein R9N61_002888 [Clostridium perfringens]|nr:hypothetical protein [Clostridium perfringens]
MSDKNKLKVTLDAKNLENVKNTFKVINNKVFTQKGEFTTYDMELLDALLGENWVNEYAVGKTYMRIWSY